MKTETVNANHFALDPRATSSLRRALNDDPQAAIQQAAQQFEGLLLQMMLKSMRDATSQDGLLDNEQTRFFTSILDQQLASDLSAKGSLGFARQIAEQMGRNLPMNSGALDAALDQLQSARAAQDMQNAQIVQTVQGMQRAQIMQTAQGGQAAKSAAELAGSVPMGVPESAREYVDRVLPHAQGAAKTLGVPPHFLVAHSALESGWGKSEIRREDGSPSYNVFGIKAQGGWKGDSVEVTTTEYIDGIAQTRREKFRAYGSYGEAFQDYARLLSGHSRYSEVLGERDGTRFARALQDSGYATDPGYADKLSRVIGGPTLRQAMA